MRKGTIVTAAVLMLGLSLATVPVADAISIDWMALSGLSAGINPWLQDSSGDSPGTTFAMGTYVSWQVDLMWCTDGADTGQVYTDWAGLLTEYKTGNVSNSGNHVAVQSVQWDGENAFPPGVFGFGSTNFNDSDTKYDSSTYYVRFFNGDKSEAGFVANTNSAWDAGTPFPSLTFDMMNVGAGAGDMIGIDGTESLAGLDNDGTPGYNTGDNWYTTSIPEPGTMSLFGIGLAILGLRRRKKK